MPDPTIAGRIMAEEQVQADIQWRLLEMEVSARANAPHADRIDPDWQARLDAKRRRLEAMRDGLEKSIIATRKGQEEDAHG